MGDHLHRATQVVAAALLAQYGFVNAAGGEIITLVHFCTNKTLVVAKIQVGLCAIFSYEHLAVLKRAHGAWIHIDVGVQFQQGYFQPTRFENRPERCRGNTFAKRRNNAASDEDETRHVMPIYRASKGAGLKKAML